MNIMIFAIVVGIGIGLTLTASSKEIMAQTITNDNNSFNNNNNKPIIIHVHPHLKLMFDGKPVTIPAQIGIDPSLWKDHSFDQYGMRAMNMNMVMPAMAPLHTHDTSGIIHVESNTIRPYTLGEFLNIWGGLDTTGKTVKATVDGTPVSDYKNITLRDGEQISLDVER